MVKGNQKAVDFGVQLIGLSLHQLFCDAFNVKFEHEERQAHLKARQEGKDVRNILTNAIDYYRNNYRKSEQYKNFVIMNCSKEINKAVFGRIPSKLKQDWNLAKNQSLRDSFTDFELKYIAEIEHLAARLILLDGIEPLAAVKEAVSRLRIPVSAR